MQGYHGHREAMRRSACHRSSRRCVAPRANGSPSNGATFESAVMPVSAAECRLWHHERIGAPGMGGRSPAMARFTTTRWSMFLRARGTSPDARSALDALCRTYRAPVLAYIRRHGHAPDIAEDLTQSFF